MLPKSLLLPAGMVVAALAVALVMLLVVGAPDGAAPSAPKAPTTAGTSERAPVPLPDVGGFTGGSLSPARPTALSADEAAGEEIDEAAFEELMDPPMQPWEAAINQILESDEENQQVVTRLLALVPTLPPDGQVEAAQHMVNLTDDDNYQNAAAMLLNPATSEEVAEVIYSDALNRPNNVKLPVLVSILRTPGHRLRDETFGTLQVFLGEDLGENADAWNLAVQNFLAREAQEEAAVDLEFGDTQ